MKKKTSLYFPHTELRILLAIVRSVKPELSPTGKNPHWCLDSIVTDIAGLILKSKYNIFLLHLHEGWEKHSGNFWYPVPSTETGLTPEQCFEKYTDSKPDTSAFWDISHPYGKLNHEAYEYVLKKLEEVMNVICDVEFTPPKDPSC